MCLCDIEQMDSARIRISCVGTLSLYLFTESQHLGKSSKWICFSFALQILCICGLVVSYCTYLADCPALHQSWCVLAYFITRNICMSLPAVRPLRTSLDNALSTKLEKVGCVSRSASL